ncbi:Ldh family oxidoreductase [Rubrobacter taiwanensis]|jgi:LDH2 family malate/lactate/ureidoglycolate dehydrogenase|uniref:Ldh family oxidoreductase n=1 Tax=Rubrobacter taiwanensis TaxID=185139 RepID=A0A4R1BFN2_9ACTN|nr:Ldh family oxidoreductase [Rubrobacter taiwanensis]TCJ16006.1 Ldh family oxidoreductase [Rubrobacter taiwanensis]
MVESKKIRVKEEDLREFCTRILESAGVPRNDAEIVADSLVDADLAGTGSHGVTRMSDYLGRMEQGLVSPVTKIELVRETPSTALLDANNGWGQVASERAVELVVRKARETGSAWVGVRNSNHNGTAAYWTVKIAHEGMVGICSMNTSPVMAAHGSRRPTLGTNPLSIAVPSSSGRPAVLDMATSEQARGKIILAAKNNEPIPEGWAITKDGLPTTDAKEALKGSVLPLGGPKGSGLAIMLDILSGVLTGASFGATMPRMYDDPAPQRVGHIFSAIDIEAFMPLDEFLARMDEKERETREGPPAPGFERVRMPGDGRHERQAERRTHGIPLSPEIHAELLRLAKRYGVPAERLRPHPRTITD